MEIARHWRLKQQRYGLVGEVCPHCDFKIFPPRDICPNCSGNTKIKKATGTIYEAPISLPTEVSTSSR
jgi:hypothetical protein